MLNFPERTNLPLFRGEGAPRVACHCSGNVIAVQVILGSRSRPTREGVQESHLICEVSGIGRGNYFRSAFSANNKAHTHDPIREPMIARRSVRFEPVTTSAQQQTPLDPGCPGVLCSLVGSLRPHFDLGFRRRFLDTGDLRGPRLSLILRPRSLCHSSAPNLIFVRVSLELRTKHLRKWSAFKYTESI